MIELKWDCGILRLGLCSVGYVRQNPDCSYCYDFYNRLIGAFSQCERDMATAMEKGYAEVMDTLKSVAGPCKRCAEVSAKLKQNTWELFLSLDFEEA